MQQLPMAFINIALGGKNAALNSLGKSLSNDDFGQLLGSVQDARDWLRQELIDHLDPEQLAQLEQQLAGGMSLPEAASIYLQQQRQAVDLPPPVLERRADGPTVSESPSRPVSGLPWPLSQYLAAPPEPPPSSSAAALPEGFEPSDTGPSAVGSTAMAPLAAVATAPTGEGLPRLEPPPSESPVAAGLVDPPPIETAPLVSGAAVEPIAAEVAASGSVAVVPPASAVHPPAVEGLAAVTVPRSSPDAGRAATSTPPAASSPAGRADALPVAPIAAEALIRPEPRGAIESGLATAPGVTDDGPGEAALPAPPPLVNALRALWRSREPSVATVADRAVESTTRPESSPLAPRQTLAAGLPSAATPPSLPFGFLNREGQHAPGPVVNAQPQAVPPGANAFNELAAAPLPNPSPGVAESSGPTDRLVMSLFGVTTGTEGAAGSAPRSPAAPALELAVPQRLHENGWSQALGERLVLMAGREQQTAEIKLNPAHLGPLEVKLSLQQDQASVSFVSQHAPVREALEQAIPRLREMFNQQDLQLVNVDVGQRREPATGGDGAGRGHGSRPGAGESGGDAAAGETIDVVISPRAEATDGRLDLYA